MSGKIFWYLESHYLNTDALWLFRENKKLNTSEVLHPRTGGAVGTSTEGGD